MIYASNLFIEIAPLFDDHRMGNFTQNTIVIVHFYPKKISRKRDQKLSGVPPGGHSIGFSSGSLKPPLGFAAKGIDDENKRNGPRVCGPEVVSCGFRFESFLVHV